MYIVRNPFASHLTRRQHSKLAAHYLRRYRAMAEQRNKTDWQSLDYSVMFHKYLYHKRAGEALWHAETQARTEAGILELGTVTSGAQQNEHNDD